TQFIRTVRGADDAVVPEVTITGLTAPFGDVFNSMTKLRTYELRDTLTLDRGAHTIRLGGEARRIFKGLSIGPPTAGTFTFNSLLDFVEDKPFRQTLTVAPDTGVPTNFGRYFTLYETGLFVQDDWKINPRLNLNLGVRHDYFGTVTEREERLSSLVLGAGESFREQIASASIGRVDRLYQPERLNFSPRVGFALDPTGSGTTSIRAGFSMAYQPHHGQSISGARALPPDAIQSVIQPSNQIGSRILYGIPAPFNPEFARGLNEYGGVRARAGERPVRITGFVVNPEIKTQYSESWFLNAQRRLPHDWAVEVGYVGTTGINLERIDDINRFNGDLLDGREDRTNANFGVLLFVTNGLTSSYNAMTVEVRRPFSRGFSLQTNYRWSKWLDTSSDTSTGQFQDNAEPGKGATNINCLRCERARSMFDIPHRFSSSVMWTPTFFKGSNNFIEKLSAGWQISAIFTGQSGRPFSVWDGRSFSQGGDYNADGGGGAVGGGFYDRPDAPETGTIRSSFSRQDFLNGLFDPGVFPKPAPGRDGTLGRNTFRGQRYITLDLSLARSFAVRGEKQLQFRLEAFNALNAVNLFLPNADLSLSTFGKSTQAFEPRTVQAGLKFVF
nr:TonB-dependent receptor [Pyrinomonadaceae bacterium]